MTLEERIEAAARAISGLDRRDWPAVPEGHRAKAFMALRAAFPELFTDPPTHWLAPVEATERMKTLAEVSPVGWREARDAYLNREEK